MVEAPRHILSILELLRKYDKIGKGIVTLYNCSRLWFAHSYAVNLSLVSSCDRKERKFGVANIIEKKAGKEYGDLVVQPCKTPVINLQATELTYPY